MNSEHSSYQETEIKLPIQELAAAVQSVDSLGARIAKPRHFEDNLILDNKEHQLRNRNQLLRLRIVDENEQHAILTFKGPSQILDGIKKREELECEVQGARNFIKTFSELGFFIVFRYQKYRTIFSVKDITLDICIDETPIGNYFELEGEIDRIHEYAAKLGYSRAQYIPDSYATLYQRWCQERGEAPSHMIFAK